MARFQPLSPTAQTAYAQLFDAARAVELSRSVANLRGSFARKRVKGRSYWWATRARRGRDALAKWAPDLEVGCLLPLPAKVSRRGEKTGNKLRK